MATVSWTRRLLPVVHDDGQLLAVNKPAGIDTGSYAGLTTLGVQELLRREMGDKVRLVPINRLSRYESGILLFAKAEGFARVMKTALRKGEITQEFVAVAKGEVKVRKLVIDSSHGTSRGHSRPKKERAKSQTEAPTMAREATSVEVNRTVGERVMIRCRTSLDNTHAMRAQLRAAGLRLLGDRTPGKYQREPKYSETCLHLAKVTLQHPDRGVKVTISCPTPLAFDAHLQKKADWTRVVHAALVRRLGVLTENQTNAYRLLSGHVEDMRGVTVERFGDVVIIRAETDADMGEGQFRAMAEWYREWLDVKTVCLRHAARKRKAGSEEADGEPAPDKMLLGKSLPEEIVVVENGLKFLVRPQLVASQGLFLDQRDNRQLVQASAANKDVLNLFAYTCGFSVAAAVGGAKRVVSVDLSPKNIEWGQANFALNDLPVEGHLFLAAHVAQFLKRGTKDAEKYDFIVVDPPSFAHGRKSGQDFSVERDLTGLVAAIVPLLRAGGRLLVSMNLRRMSWRAFRERVRGGLSARKITSIEPLTLPPDFAMDGDHSKSLLVTLS